MPFKNAQRNSFCMHNRWAFLIAPLYSALLMTSCKQAPEPKQMGSDAEMCLLNPPPDFDDELDTAVAQCHRQDQGPVLYAHYLSQTAKEEISSNDPEMNTQGSVSCAPGPVLLDFGNSVDSGEWVLKKLPDYFAWHLSSKSSVDEMMYIASANGLPIKSQSIKLENGHDATLVLFPKTSLNPGTKYYLYLVRTTQNATQKWIQPLVMTANNSTAPVGDN